MKYSSLPSPTLHLFDFENNPPSIANLRPDLTINGSTVYPTFRYKASDATLTTWPSWGYGNILTLTGSGAEPTLNLGSPFYGSIDNSVKGSSTGITKIFQGTTNAEASVGTCDFCIEAIVTAGANGSYNAYFVDRKSSGTTNGWTLGDGSAVIYMYLHYNNNDNRIGIPGPPLVTNGNTVMHMMWFFNRDENSTDSANSYLNGVYINHANIYAANGVNIVSETPLRMLASYVGATTNIVHYAAMWKLDNWFASGATGPSQWATIAAQRFYQLTGVWPNSATGTYAPTTCTRNSVAYLDKYESDGTKKLYLVGTNWPRTCERQEASTTRRLKGYLSEPSATNLCLYSQDGTVVVWVHSSNIGHNVSASILSPDGLANATAIIGSSLDANCFTGQITSLTGSAVYTLSYYLKTGSATWFTLRNYTTGKLASFNAVTGAVGTVNSGITAHTESLGNGWFRLGITFTANAGNNQWMVYASTTDGGVGWTGDSATITYYVFGVQLELGTVPSSYIPTTSAVVTRAADSLRFTAGNNFNANSTLEGSMFCKTLVPNYDVASQLCLFEAYKGAADIISTTIETTDIAQANTLATAGSAGVSTGTTDIANGNIHSINNIWRTNQLKLFVDGVQEGTEDTSVTVPTAITALHIGENNGANQLNGLISDIRIYDKVRTNLK